MGNLFRTLLVIGDNPEEIAARYSADRKVDKYRKYELNEAPKLHRQYLELLEKSIKSLEGVGTEKSEAALEYYKDIYDEYKEMDDFEFFQALTQDCDHDSEGDALTDENPDAHYCYEKCYNDRILKDQSFEAPFSDPFILKDGTKAYTAKVRDIDWAKVHKAKAPVYRAVWEICVDGREPENDDEKVAFDVMKGRDAYFANFRTVDEYVNHCSAFWTYAVASKDGYHECTGRDIDWTNGFYDRFIKPLNPDETVSVFEMKLLE